MLDSIANSLRASHQVFAALGVVVALNALASAQEVMQAIDELASPVTAFVRECCVVGPGYRVIRA